MIVSDAEAAEILKPWRDKYFPKDGNSATKKKRKPVKRDVRGLAPRTPYYGGHYPEFHGDVNERLR